MKTQRMQPQPPKGIRYLLGNESWLEPDKRTPLRLEVEEWGNLGPMMLDPTIPKNEAGFRVRSHSFLAPEWARGFATQNGLLVWTSDAIHGGDLDPE